MPPPSPTTAAPAEPSSVGAPPRPRELPQNVFSSIVAARLASAAASAGVAPALEIELAPPRRDAVALTLMASSRALVGVAMASGAAWLFEASRRAGRGDVRGANDALEVFRYSAVAALVVLAVSLVCQAWWVDRALQNYEIVRRTGAARLADGARRWWVFAGLAVVSVVMHLVDLPFRTENIRLASSAVFWAVLVVVCLSVSVAAVKPVLRALDERLLSVRSWLVVEFALFVGLLVFWDVHVDDADGLAVTRSTSDALAAAATWWFTLAVTAIVTAVVGLGCASIVRRGIARRRADIERPDAGIAVPSVVLVPKLIEGVGVRRRLLSMQPYLVGLALGHVAWGLIRIVGAISLFLLRDELAGVGSIDGADDAIGILQDYTQFALLVTGLMFALHGAWLIATIVNTHRATLDAPPIPAALVVVLVPIALIASAAVVGSHDLVTMLVVAGAVAGMVCFSASFRLLASCAKAVAGDVRTFRTWSLVIGFLYLVQALGLILNQRAQGGEAVGLAIVLEATSGVVILIGAVIGTRSALRLDGTMRVFRQTSRASTTSG
jgi:hypothetical protein